jgi:hypothetical protein
MMKRDAGLQVIIPDNLRDLDVLGKDLFAESENLIQEALDLERPLLFAQSLVTQAFIMITAERDNRYIRAQLRQKDILIAPDNVVHFRKRLEDAIGIFQRAGFLESEIWAKLSLADWLEVAGETEGPKSIAAEVHPVAVAMGYRQQIVRADDYLTGRTEFQKTMEYLTTERNTDAEMASATDHKLKLYVDKSMAGMGVPESCRAVVERNWLAMREIAREKMRWCRHLDMVEAGGTDGSAETAFASDPERRCVCRKFQYVSRFQTPDLAILLVAFKNAYCQDCLAKEPKETASTKPS